MEKTIQPHRPAFFHGAGGKKRNNAQSILEYALLIICIVAALLGMQVYIKRGMQGRLRQTADELGQQYAPKNTVGKSTLTYNSTSTTKVETLSERQFTDRYGYNVDLDGDGVIEDDVFATETLSIYGRPGDADGDGIISADEYVGGSESQQKGDETVGPLESSLF